MVGQSQVIVLMVILFVGIVFGAGVAWWMLSSRKSNAPQAETNPAADALAALRVRYAELAGLWQEKVSGKLVLRLEGQMLQHAGQLSPDQRARLEALTKEMQAWLGMAQPEPSAATSAPSPAIILPAPQASPATAAALPVQPVQRQAPVAANAAAAAAPAKPKSIVEQIDEILQDKLANSTSSHKGVRLADDALHGVVVWIGLEHFDGVDRVTDPEVRALLREAAQEWERRTTLAKK